VRVVLICEFSGIVRDAFIAAGHDAISCDLEPSETAGPHIQGDCRDYNWYEYDLAICFPPCRYLSYVGNAWWNRPGREALREEAMRFFMWCYNLPVKRVAVENPKGYPLRAFRKQDQIVQPYYWGDPYHKGIYLWLKNLPLLYWVEKNELFLDKTAIERPDYGEFPSGKKKAFTDMFNNFDREKSRKMRSRFFSGVAQAMADPWGCL
jgi:hypothetical protein